MQNLDGNNVFYLQFLRMVHELILQIYICVTISYDVFGFTLAEE